MYYHPYKKKSKQKSNSVYIGKCSARGLYGQDAQRKGRRIGFPNVPPVVEKTKEDFTQEEIDAIVARHKNQPFPHWNWERPTEKGENHESRQSKQSNERFRRNRMEKRQRRA